MKSKTKFQNYMRTTIVNTLCYIIFKVATQNTTYKLINSYKKPQSILLNELR